MVFVQRHEPVLLAAHAHGPHTSSHRLPPRPRIHGVAASAHAGGIVQGVCDGLLAGLCT